MADTTPPVAPKADETTKVERTPSTAELDLQARLASDYVSPSQIERNDNNDLYGADENGFVGVSPEYANYANVGEKPLAAKSGVWKDVEKAHTTAIEDTHREPSDAVKAVSEDSQSRVVGS